MLLISCFPLLKNNHKNRLVPFLLSKMAPTHSFCKFSGPDFVAYGVLVSRMIRDSPKSAEAQRVPSFSLGILPVLVGARSIGKQGPLGPGAKQLNGPQGQSLPDPEIVTQEPSPPNQAQAALPGRGTRASGR